MANRTSIEQNVVKVIGELDASMSPVTTIMFGGSEQNEYVGPFFAITALSQAVIDVSECTTNIKTRTGIGPTGAVTTDITIPLGVTIYGDFTSIELDSGTVVAYSRPGVEVKVLT